MKTNILTLTGKKGKEIRLPSHFSEKIRKDVIKRAVLAQQSNSLQPKGTQKLAGMRKVHWLSKRRNVYKSTYGRGTSRTPMKTMVRRGMRFVFRGAFAPQTKGGRSAHPPMVEKKIVKNINKKERKLAIRSAIAATSHLDLVKERGHKYDGIVPIIMINDIEKIKKSKDVETLLLKLGMKEELQRIKKKKIRAGKGKMRGRKYKRKVGPLFVVSERCDLMKSVGAVPGTQSILVKDLNAEILAPGTYPGRLTIWSEKAIQKLEGMFK